MQTKSYRTLYSAGPRARYEYGGFGTSGIKYAGQENHDLGLTSVYLNFRQHRPDEAVNWRGEDWFKTQCGAKNPDAFIIDPTTYRPRLAIEHGGRYNKTRLKEFSRGMEEIGLAYEIY